MGIGDKIKNAGQDAAGKAKEGVGDATDDREMQADGTSDQAGAKVKKAGEDVKDALR